MRTYKIERKRITDPKPQPKRKDCYTVVQRQAPLMCSDWTRPYEVYTFKEFDSWEKARVFLNRNDGSWELAQ